VGIHLLQDARLGDAPGRSAVAEITPDNALSGVRMCRSDGEIVEAVGDAAALVPVGDVDALADALTQVCDDADRRADLAARGRRRAATFSWDRCADGLVALYRRAAEEAPCGRS